MSLPSDLRGSRDLWVKPTRIRGLERPLDPTVNSAQQELNQHKGLAASPVKFTTKACFLLFASLKALRPYGSPHLDILDMLAPFSGLYSPNLSLKRPLSPDDAISGLVLYPLLDI